MSGQYINQWEHMRPSAADAQAPPKLNRSVRAGAALGAQQTLELGAAAFGVAQLPFYVLHTQQRTATTHIRENSNRWLD